MAQLEDQTPKCCNSIGNVVDDNGDGSNGNGVIIGNNISRLLRKSKQKKVPQRGLGVAQLEKIRLEEQKMKEAATKVVLSSPSEIQSSFISIPMSHYHLYSNQSSSSSVPFSSPLSVDLSSANSIFRPSFSRPNSTVTLANNDEILEHSSDPKLWNSYEYILENEQPNGLKLNPGFSLRSNMNFSYESKPIWPLNGKKMQQSQQLFPSFVNVPSTTSSSSSSVLSYPMEPPSNQNYYGVPLSVWPEEDKMIGMKRSYSYPFTLPAFASVPLRANTIHSCTSIENTLHLEPSNQKLRKYPSCSKSIISESNLKNRHKQKDDPHGAFLALSPPIDRTSFTSSKFTIPSTHPTLDNCKMRKLSSITCQGSDTKFKPASTRLMGQQPFYNFLTQEEEQNGEVATSLHDWNGEEEKRIDLNLKL